jgi:hypothetical protein
MEIIFLIGAFVLLVILIFFIVLITNIKRSRKFNKEIDHYLMEGWKAIAEKNILKAREVYEKIRIDYKSKYDKKKKLMKRINLFYNKIVELYSLKV